MSENRVAGFLRDAWGGLVGLEEVVHNLGGEDGEAAREALIAHGRRLRDSAAGWEFPKLARLAASLERLGKALPRPEHGGFEEAVQLVVDATTVLPMVFDNIASEASEHIPQLDGLQWRFDAELPGAEAAARERAEQEAPGEIDLALRSFRFEDPEALSFFGPEAEEHLDGLLSCFQRLERGPTAGSAAVGTEEAGILQEMFRRVHTVKGAAYTVGCQPVGDLAHGIENLLAQSHRGKTPLGRRRLERCKEAVDLLGEMLGRLGGEEGPSLQSTFESMLVDLADAPRTAADSADERRDPATGETGFATDASSFAIGGTAAPITPSPPEEQTAVLSPPESESPEQRPGGRSFREDRAEPSSPFRPQELEAQKLGAGELGAGELGAGELGAPVAGPALSDDRPGGLQEDRPSEDGAPVFHASLRIELPRLDRLIDEAGEVVVSRRRLHGFTDELLAAADDLASIQRRLGDLLHAPGGPEDPGYASPGPVALAPNAPSSSSAAPEPVTPHEVDGASKATGGEPLSPLRHRLAEVTADASVLQQDLGTMAARLGGQLEGLRKMTRRLRSELAGLRRLPISQLFARFDHLVTESAAMLGKQIRVVTEGGELELDHEVLERLAEPLTHLVQNALHHGLETPDERLEQGKSRVGALRLRARKWGRRVRLEVEDDGRGIDLDALRRVAAERGFVDGGAQTSDREALELLFLSGLSTSRRVSTGAGRGVGMDAVRHAASRLGGQLLVETEKGEGTRFTLEVPSTLLVSEALYVQAGGHTFGIPVAAVTRLDPQEEKRLLTRGDTSFLDTGEGRLELVSVAQRLGLPSGPPPDIPGVSGIAVTVAAAPRPIALVVESVSGAREVVIKPLGAYLADCAYFSGASVDRDGHVVLMLDALALCRGETSFETPRIPAAAADSATDPPEILVVDDSLSVRRVLERTLTEAGYRVSLCVDGDGALERLEERRPAALITDLEMPGMAGDELVRRIRRRAGWRDLPILVVTGRRPVAGGLAPGAQVCLSKPVHREVVLEELARLLGTPRPRREVSSS